MFFLTTVFFFVFDIGYTIPKGWTVQIWSVAVHMDSQIYSNPQDFDPSRWDVCFTILLLFAKIKSHIR